MPSREFSTKSREFAGNLLMPMIDDGKRAPERRKT
jgi:hypothetical protein